MHLRYRSSGLGCQPRVARPHTPARPARNTESSIGGNSHRYSCRLCGIRNNPRDITCSVKPLCRVFACFLYISCPGVLQTRRECLRVQAGALRQLPRCRGEAGKILAPYRSSSPQPQQRSRLGSGYARRRQLLSLAYGSIAPGRVKKNADPVPSPSDSTQMRPP